MNPRKKFREMIGASSCIIQAVGAHNALGAKLIEKNGFDAVWASGFEISASYAKPDANILTMTEFLSAADQMVEATTLPVIADCDTGFGNVNNVIRMVKDYEKIGVSGVCIEDKIFPKVNSFVSGFQKLIPAKEFINKIAAAKDTQKDPDFIVIARVESLIAGAGMEETLRRAELYHDAGADMILIHSKHKDPSEIFEFCHKWNRDLPLVVVPTTYPTLTVEDIRKSKKIKMVIYANQALRAAVKAVNQMLKSLKDSGSLQSVNPDLERMDSLFELQQLRQMLKKEEYYNNFGSKKLTKVK